MEEFTELDKIIDHRNQEFWKQLTEYFDIELIRHEKPYAELFSKERSAQIFLNEDVDISSFTHELLHLWTEQQEIYVQSTFRSFIQSHEKLSKIFCNDLIVHFGNVCEHVKMYPIFVSMGFEADGFLHDNNVHKCKASDLKVLEKRYKFLWTYQTKAVDIFIGKFFAVHADHNDQLDYTNCKNRLNKLDSKLYGILSNFWNNWLNYDLTKEDDIYVSYIELLSNFQDELENWVARKILI